MRSSYSSLCCHCTCLGLRQPMLHAPGNVSMCWLWTCLYYSSLSCLGRAYPIAAFDASGLSRNCSKADFDASRAVCAFPGHVCVCCIAVSAVTGGIWPGAACLCFKCTYLFNSRHCCAKGFMAYSTAACAASLLSTLLGVYIYMGFCAAPGVSVYQSFVLHLDVSAYNSFVLHLDVPVYKNLCCTCACLPTRALWCTWMCLPTRALCCTWTCLPTRTFAVPVRVCLQELCAAPGRVCLQEYRQRWNCRCSVVKNVLVCFGLFRNRYVFFGCFETCSKHPNKPEKLFFGFVKQTETQPKHIEFRFFSVRTENIFCLFRGHPTAVHVELLLCGPG